MCREGDPGPGAGAGVAAQRQAAGYGGSAGPVRLYEDLAAGVGALTGLQADTDGGYLTARLSLLTHPALQLTIFTKQLSSVTNTNRADQHQHKVSQPSPSF